MSTPVLPVIITGPAVISHDARFLYVRKDITVEYETESFFIESAHGRRDERHKSRVTKVKCTPVGELRSTADLAKNYPFGPAQIGKTIFPAAPALVIYSLGDGKTYTFPRMGVAKYPKQFLGPTKQPFGDMEFWGIGKPATQPTASDYWKTVATAALADTSYADTNVKTDIYTATLGSRLAPYNAMGAIDGFEVDPVMTPKIIYAADVGIGDIIVSDLWLNVMFAPSNLTEEEVDALLSLQGAGAILPGQSYAKAGEDLIIDSDAYTLTCKRMGAKQAGYVFDKDEHRHRQLLFTTQRTGNITSSDALWTMTVN
jgi:hypothetical protein